MMVCKGVISADIIIIIYDNNRSILVGLLTAYHKVRVRYSSVRKTWRKHRDKFKSHLGM